MPKIRILVVDDSVVVRRMLTNVLSSESTLEVVGTAPNGRIALAKITQVNPDLIVLDVEMPDMDGLETLAAIRQTYPQLPVIMFSAITERGAVATLDALALGANDYVTKPAQLGSKKAAFQYIRNQLIPKIQVFCSPLVVNQTKLVSSSLRPALSRSRRDPLRGAGSASASPRSPLKSRDWTKSTVAGDRPPVEILAIGVSTGGPNALATLLSALPAKLPIPVVIVQHMPPVFTKRLAERLTTQCQIRVDEGKTEDILQPGRAWLAPGDYHLIVERDGTQVRLRTHQAPPENSCRPAVDVLFRSVAKTYQGGVLAIVLTGMGQDGLHGCECIREAGGQVLVQDEASSVVWGMPGIVANAGLANKVLPLNQMANDIMRRVKEGKR